MNDGPTGGSPLHATGIISASILGTSLAFIDGSVVTVALPSIGRDLHASAAELAWTVNAYALPLGALILLGGAAGDHYGRRKFFQFGIALFLLASILCSAAPTLDLLLAGRGLQGIGAALLMPNSLATLGAIFSGEARGRAIGTWAAAGAIAGVVGPLIGGWIVDVSNWRLIFLINLPIGLAAMAMAARYVPESRDHGRSGGLDWWGGFFATLGLGALVWGLTAAAEPHIPRVAIHAAVAGGVALLALFLGIEWRRDEAALMPFALFGTATFAGLTLMTFFLYAALGGLMVLLPFMLIRLGGYTGVQAGAALLPVPLAIVLGSRMMGRVAGRIGGRLPLAAGSAITAIGLGLYRGIEVGGIDYMRDILPPTLVIALGMAICVAPLTTAVMNSFDADHAGAASGFNSAMARIGGLIATALLGFVFASAGSDTAFVASVRVAATVASAAAAFAALCALLLIRSTKGETL